VLPLLAYPTLSNAQKGAFELDAEYYVKNLLGTQSLEKDRVIYPSPRIIDNEISNKIVMLTKSEISYFSNVSTEELSIKINEMIPIYINFLKICSNIKF